MSAVNQTRKKVLVVTAIFAVSVAFSLSLSFVLRPLPNIFPEIREDGPLNVSTLWTDGVIGIEITDSSNNLLERFYNPPIQPEYVYWFGNKTPSVITNLTVVESDGLGWHRAIVGGRQAWGVGDEVITLSDGTTHVIPVSCNSISRYNYTTGQTIGVRYFSYFGSAASVTASLFTLENTAFQNEQWVITQKTVLSGVHASRDLWVNR
jgi:hypothetical protein